jgi:glucosamine kinase
MTQFLIGVDGGGTGTRVRLASGNGQQLAQAEGGPSGLALGIPNAWANIDAAIGKAFAAAGIERPANGAIAVGAGLAGVHNKEWARAFETANPGFATLRLETDGYTTLIGAHNGKPGIIVAIGTGSVGEGLSVDGTHREVGGWGFPAGDEASGGWMGLKAINHMQQVLDGRRPSTPLARAVAQACGGERDAIQAWLGGANQTAFASLAPRVIQHAADDVVASAILQQAGAEVASIAAALDPTYTLPLALCGGLGAALRGYLPERLLARTVPPAGDAAAGALRMIQLQLEG